jgi:hypothetical protein
MTNDEIKRYHDKLEYDILYTQLMIDILNFDEEKIKISKMAMLIELEKHGNCFFNKDAIEEIKGLDIVQVRKLNSGYDERSGAFIVRPGDNEMIEHHLQPRILKLKEEFEQARIVYENMNLVEKYQKDGAVATTTQTDPNKKEKVNSKQLQNIATESEFERGHKSHHGKNKSNIDELV